MGVSEHVHRTEGVVMVPVTERTGVWCPACSLPSAALVLALSYESDTLVLVRSDYAVVCAECARQWPTVRPARC